MRPDPRRILLLITDLEIGGTPTVVRELAIRLREPGRVEVEVACLSRWGPVADQLESAGVAVTPLNARGIHHFPVAFLRLVRLIRRGRFDTVFSFLIHANGLAALASPLCPGVRFLQSIQTTQPRPRWHWWLQRRVSIAAEAVVVPSPSAARAAREWARVPAKAVVVIPNAVDADAFERSPVPLEDPRPYPIGFIGRLDPVKRVEVLIGAVRLPVSKEPLTLHIFGQGRQRAALEQYVRHYGCESLVTLHGAVARPQEALCRLGMLVLPSWAEGFGLVLIEAMAAGVPVVAANSPGIRDVVSNGLNGLLVSHPPTFTSPPTAHDFALAIKKLVEDPALRRRLIKNGLEDVRSRFSWGVVLPQYRALLRIAPPPI